MESSHAKCRIWPVFTQTARLKWVKLRACKLNTKILQPSRDLACHCWLNHASVVCAYVRSVGSHCTRRGGGGGAALQLWAWGSVSAQIHFDKLVYADWYLESWCWMQASHWISCSYRWIMELHMSSSRGGWVVGLKAGVLYNHPAS